MGGRKVRRIIWKACIFVLVLAVLMALLSFYISYITIHPPRTQAVLTPRDYGMPYEEAAFESLDGLELKGWLIEKERSDSVIILCHGHGSNRGDILPVAEFLYENGYSVFLFDFRAHGDSGGTTATLGWLETKDLTAAMGYVKEKAGSENIGVIGFSMGGATAITTAGRVAGIDAVVADSAFADRYLLVSSIFNIPPLSLMVPLFAGMQGLDMEENLPRDYAGNISPSALMIIHGSLDHLVGVEDAQLLYDLAEGPKEIWIAEDAAHVMAYSVHEREYEKRVLEFFGEHMGG